MARKLVSISVLSLVLFFLGTCFLVEAADKSEKKSKHLTWEIPPYSKGFLQLSKSGSLENITFHLRKTSEDEVRKVLGQPEKEEIVGESKVVTYHLGHLPAGTYPDEYYSPMMIVTLKYGQDAIVSWIEKELDKKERLIPVKPGTWVMSK